MSELTEWARIKICRPFNWRTRVDLGYSPPSPASLLAPLARPTLGYHAPIAALTYEDKMPTNMQVLLASRPSGWVQESNFNIVETPIPKPGPGEVLIKNHWLSLDP